MKSVSGNTVTIESVNEDGKKETVVFVVSGDSIVMTDPDGKELYLKRK